MALGSARPSKGPCAEVWFVGKRPSHPDVTGNARGLLTRFRNSALRAAARVSRWSLCTTEPCHVRFFLLARYAGVNSGGCPRPLKAMCSANVAFC